MHIVSGYSARYKMTSAGFNCNIGDSHDEISPKSAKKISQ